MEVAIMAVILFSVYAIGYHHGEKDTVALMKDEQGEL